MPPIKLYSPQRLKPTRNEPLIAALKRCATQKQRHPDSAEAISKHKNYVIPRRSQRRLQRREQPGICCPRKSLYKANHDSLMRVRLGSACWNGNSQRTEFCIFPDQFRSLQSCDLARVPNRHLVCRAGSSGDGDFQTIGCPALREHAHSPAFASKWRELRSDTNAEVVAEGQLQNRRACGKLKFNVRVLVCISRRKMESDGFAVQFCANKLCPRRECGRKREVYLFSGVLELQSDLVGGAPKTKLDRAVRDMQIAD